MRLGRADTLGSFSGPLYEQQLSTPTVGAGFDRKSSKGAAVHPSVQPGPRGVHRNQLHRFKGIHNNLEHHRFKFIGKGGDRHD